MKATPSKQQPERADCEKPRTRTKKRPASVQSERPSRKTTWHRRHLLGIEELSPEEIIHVLDTAAGFAEVSTRSIKKVPALRGKVVVNLFIEDSTRTRSSFTLAAQRLSADVLDFYSASPFGLLLLFTVPFTSTDSDRPVFE